MSSFSERYGYVKPSIALSEEKMPASLRAGIWDNLISLFFNNIIDETYTRIYSENFDSITYRIWFDFLREPTDLRPKHPSQALDILRKFVLGESFYHIYDLIEFMLSISNENKAKQLRDGINSILEREQAAFRIAGNRLVKIIDKAERDEVSSALASQSTGVKTHIQAAIDLLAKRPSPDYRNSIKESISAVEAAVRFVSGTKGTGVGNTLRGVLDENVLHPALRQGFEKLYAYTSDSGGIRHALNDDDREVTQADARYMLISCSAFANYLIALKSEKKT